MIPTLYIKGHQGVVSAYATQGRQIHLISLVGVRESVRAALSALQHGHSGVLKHDESTLVNLGYQSVKIIQGRLPSGAFQAVAIGERVTKGDILILPTGANLAERFYLALLDKSTLPLHTVWQDKLLELAREAKVITLLTAYGVQAYAFDTQLSAFESHVRRALISGDLPEIGESTCV